MRTQLRTILLISIICWQTALCLPSSAAMMYFSPDAVSSASGSIDVVLPVDKLGSVPVQRGRIDINGSQAELSMIEEWQFDRQIVLYGTVLDTRIDTTGKQPMVRGVVLFTDGAWIDYFDDKRSDETVVRTNGESVTGRIAELEPHKPELTVEAAGNRIVVPLSDVTEVRSPRVFTFAIPTTTLQQRSPSEPFFSDARSITFASTSRPFRTAALKRTILKQMDQGDWSTRKLVAVGTLLSLVELAQMVPTIAVPVGAGPTFHRQLIQRSLPFK